MPDLHHIGSAEEKSEHSLDEKLHMKALKEEKGHGKKKEAGNHGSGQQADKGSTKAAKSQSD